MNNSRSSFGLDRGQQRPIAITDKQCLYLEDLLLCADISPNLALLKLLVVEEAEAFHLSRRILEESGTQTSFQQRLNLIETILVNKFPYLGTQEILRMLDLKTADITQSRFYQEADLNCTSVNPKIRNSDSRG